MSTASDIANTDIVLLAMALSGAADGFVDVEVIAEKAFELSPQRFGWRTKAYPSDKTVVQAIADLEGKHSKDEVTRRGVKDQADRVATRRLTPEGREKARRVAERVSNQEFPDLASALAYFRGQSGAAAPEPTRAERRRAQGELQELRRHPAFQAWADGVDLQSIERWTLYDAMSCLPDAPLETLRGQINQLEAVAEKWRDREIQAFLRALGDAAGVAVR